MSLSFYFVVTYNINHPTVKKFIKGIATASDSLMEFKTRSKLYHDFIEVSEAAHRDFDLKYPGLYPDNPSMPLRWITAINPAFDPEIQADEEACITADWQPNCAGSVFFTEAEDDDDEDEVDYIPDSWMFKYELFFVEDIIEMSVNGEAAFSPGLAGCTTSSYH